MREIHWWGVKVATVQSGDSTYERIEGGEVFNEVGLEDLRVSRKVVSG